MVLLAHDLVAVREQPNAAAGQDVEVGTYSDTVVVTDDGIEVLTSYPRDIESLTIPA